MEYNKNFLFLLIAQTLLTLISWHFESLLIFCCYVPIIYVVKKQPSKWLLKLFILVFAYVLTATYWIYNVGLLFAFSAWLLLSFYLFIPFLLNTIYKKQKLVCTYIAYLCFEFLLHNNYFACPWVCIGNTLCDKLLFVYPIKYISVIGLSAFILFVNYLLFKIIFIKKEEFKKKVVFIGVSLLIFFVISLYATEKNKKFSKEVNIIAINPNIYSTDSANYDVNSIINLLSFLETYDTSKQSIIIFPECFINESVLAENLSLNVCLQKLISISKTYKKTEILTGCTIIENSVSNDGRIVDAKFNMNYNKYNCAISITNGKIKDIWYKEKLTPIYEYVPQWLNFFNFKPISFSLKSNKINSFKNKDYSFKPIICFEALFGSNFLINKTQNDFLIMLACENMVEGTRTKSFYTNIARLRAIENKIPLIKIAINGESCLIDRTGKIVYLNNMKDTIISFRLEY